MAAVFSADPARKCLTAVSMELVGVGATWAFGALPGFA